MAELGVDFTKDDVIGYECKHAVYMPGIPRDHGAVPDDLIFVKEVVHLKDGRRLPTSRRLINYERPFWVTKPGYRKHKEKKEWEELSKLDKYTTTQAGLERAIKRALHLHTPERGLRRLARSPYLYGADITPTALVKRHYQDKWPTCRSENSVAVLDIETDVVHGTDDPILVAITFKNKAIMAATKQFAGDIPNYVEVMREYFYKRLPDVADSRKIELEVVLCEGPLEAIQAAMAKAHEWQPDFLAVWNINFDIPRIIDTIKKYGGDVGDIFSDPSVPKQFRNVWYKEGPATKVAASGREEPLHWVDRWHTLYAPASFYVVDQAAVFRKMRVAKGREPSYALDYILQKHAKTQKLKCANADHLSGLDWHIYMQQFEKLEYGVYNLYDCISCEILDEQPDVGDLRSSISVQIRHSDYDKFPSQPRRTVDEMHFVCLNLEEPHVIATTPDELRTEFDDMTVSVKNWIVTLPAHMVVDNGLQVLRGYELRSMIRAAVYDLDVSGAYPTGEDTLNCSRGTTIAEIIAIEGVPEDVKRAAGLNLTAGTINATEICVSVMGAPTFRQLAEHYERTVATVN